MSTEGSFSLKAERSFIVARHPSGGCAARRDVPVDEFAIVVWVTPLEVLNNPGEKLFDLLEARIGIAEKRRAEKVELP